MKTTRNTLWLIVLVMWFAFSALACGGTPTPTPTAVPTAAPEDGPAAPTAAEPTATPSTPPTAEPLPSATQTPTPTLAPIVEAPSATPASPCLGLSGSLELRMLVGPADAVGLEPEAVGDLPFTAVSDAAPYTIEGGGAVAYSNVLEEQWGTYAVTLDMQSTIQGTCGEGGLTLHVEASGTQLVTVTSEGLNAEYPWEGTHTFDLDFPLQEGATVAGEGWAFVLHLNTP